MTLSTVTDPKSSLRMEQMLFATTSSMCSFVRGSKVKDWQAHWACIRIKHWRSPLYKLDREQIVTSSIITPSNRSSSTWLTAFSTTSSVSATSSEKTSKHLSKHCTRI